MEHARERHLVPLRAGLVRALRGAASGFSILAALYGNDEKNAARDGRQLVRVWEACREGERRHVGFSVGNTDEEDP